MKKFIIILVVIGLITTTSGWKGVEDTPIMERKFEFSMISRGNNFPDFNIRKDSANFLLVYLHENKSLSEFKEDTKLDDETINNTIALLKSKDWLVEKNGKYIPSVFVATAKDGEKLYHCAEKISKQIADEIDKELPIIKVEFTKTEMVKKQSFEHWSFLILSNVLLDNWQIYDVEKNFLKRPDGTYNRPLRHGKYYYASIKENTEKDKEPFGIYGNGIMSSSTKKMIAVYGNNRYSTDYYKNLQSSDNHISNKDNKILIKMAQNFLPKLLNILEENRKYIEIVYKETGYSQEITFDEFFIWWYHYIYTQATNDMGARGILIIPSNGNFDYERS